MSPEVAQEQRESEAANRFRLISVQPLSRHERLGGLTGKYNGIMLSPWGNSGLGLGISDHSNRNIDVDAHATEQHRDIGLWRF